MSNFVIEINRSIKRFVQLDSCFPWLLSRDVSDLTVGENGPIKYLH